MAFINVILPIVIMSVFGFALQKKYRLDLKTVSTVSLYVFLPALVFKTIYETSWNINYLHIGIYIILLTHGLILINYLINKLLKNNTKESTALILSTSFMNNGNIGVPLALLALGQVAFEYSVVIMIVHTIFMSTTGIYIAAKGKASWKIALKKVLQNPIIHAVYIPILFKLSTFSICCILLSIFQENSLEKVFLIEENPESEVILLLPQSIVLQ